MPSHEANINIILRASRWAAVSNIKVIPIFRVISFDSKIVVTTVIASAAICFALFSIVACTAAANSGTVVESNE